VLFDDGFVFACPEGHPLAKARAVTDDDLARQPLLLLEEGHCLRGHALEVCRLASASDRVQFEATSLHTLVQMVAAGLGATLLPEMAVAGGLTRGTGVATVPLAEPASRRIGLVWRKATARAEAFELLADAFAAAKS